MLHLLIQTMLITIVATSKTVTWQLSPCSVRTRRGTWDVAGTSRRPCGTRTGCHGSRSRGHMTMALDTLTREAGHTTRRDTAGCWATPPPRHRWRNGSTQWVSPRAGCDLTHKHNCHFSWPVVELVTSGWPPGLYWRLMTQWTTCSVMLLLRTT